MYVDPHRRHILSETYVSDRHRDHDKNRGYDPSSRVCAKSHAWTLLRRSMIEACAITLRGPPGDLGNAPKFLPHRLFGSSKAGSYSDVGNGFSENHRRQSIIRSEPKFSRRVKRRGCFKLFSVPSWSVWTHLQFAPSAAEHVSHYLEY